MMSIEMMMRALIFVAATFFAAVNPAFAAPATQPTTQPSTRPAALQPSSITIHLKDAHPKAVFAQLANQVSANFRPSPAGLWESKEWPLVSIDLDNVSFWTALKEISAKTGLFVQRGTVERNFFVVPEASAGRLWTPYPTSETGQFLFSLQSLDRMHRGDFIAGQTTRQLNIRLIMFSEPKVRILKIAQQATIKLAIDEQGNKLPTAPVPDTSANGATWGWWLTARASLPEQVGSTITKLSGTAKVTVQTQSQSVEVPDIQAANEVERTVAGHKLVVKNVRPRGETYTITMNITRDPAKPGGWGDVNLSSTFRLLDANGIPLSRRNYGAGTNLGDFSELILMFGRDDWNGEGAGPPAKLIWEVPTEMQEIEVPFSFEDVPLPW